MEGAKEKAADAAASAKAGMDKTKATVQEKGERMTTRDPLKKDMATAKKEERKGEAELGKQAAHGHNAAERQTKQATTGHGLTGHGTGPNY